MPICERARTIKSQFLKVKNIKNEIKNTRLGDYFFYFNAYMPPLKCEKMRRWDVEKNIEVEIIITTFVIMLFFYVMQTSNRTPLIILNGMCGANAVERIF